MFTFCLPQKWMINVFLVDFWYFWFSDHHANHTNHNSIKYTEQTRKSTSNTWTIVELITCGPPASAQNLSQNMFFTGTSNSAMIPLSSDLTMGLSQTRTPPTLWQYPSKCPPISASTFHTSFTLAAHRFRVGAHFFFGLFFVQSCNSCTHSTKCKRIWVFIDVKSNYE